MNVLSSERPRQAVILACPLCGSDEVPVQARISTDSIIGLYGEDLQDAVRKEFNGTAWIDVHNCQRCCLCFFEPKLAGSPAFYERLQSFDWYYMKDKAEYEMVRRWMQPNTRLLEVGCGAGWFGKKYPEVCYTGLEYSDIAAEEARAEGLDVRTQSVQEHSLRHKAEYHVVCSFQVLEHVPDVASYISACIDCLHPDGILIVAVPSEDSYLHYLHNAPLNLPPHHLTRWPDKALEAIPMFYPVTLMAIEHEVVADVHLQSFVRTMIRRKLDEIFGRRQAITDRSFGARILDRCTSVLAKLSPTVFDDVLFRPRGHTVIAAYRKRRPTDLDS